jgi:hypothetical protein
MYKSILITGAGSGLGEGSAIGTECQLVENISNQLLAPTTFSAVR